MKKKKIIIALLIVIIIELLAVFITAIKVMNPKPKKQTPVNVKEKIKEIEEKEQEPEKETNLTEEYIEYQKLTEEEKQNLEVIPRKEKIDEKELDNIIDEQKEIELPSYFNLNNKIKINVENQGSYGLCWAFASLKTLETYLELHNNQDYNLSEIKLDYITSNLMYGTRPIHNGGSFDNFEEYLMRTGPKKQEENEYHDYEEEEYQTFIDEQDLARVTETINFPAVYEYDGNGEKSKEQIKEETEKLRKALKTHIIENGALYSTISTPTGINHYCNKSCMVSHAITIVGWDDNYKKENFKDSNGQMPENDGAYIAINSWGEEWGDKGYFYISYEDENVEKEMNGITSISMDKTESLDKVTSPKIKQILDSNYGYSYIDNKITNLTLKRITFLDLQEQELESDDIESLNILSNLGYLNLSNNKLENIDKLNIDKLYSLDLSNNNIKDISNVNLKNLKYLMLNENKNLTGIENLKNINSLELKNSNIKDIDLTKLTNLSSINLSDNPIEHITLKEKMEYVNLNNSNIISINELKNLKEIESLYLVNNNIESLEGLESVKKIGYLNLSDNKIKNIEGLKEKNISNINLTNNEIEDIEPINTAVIERIILVNNKIKDISKIKNDNIKYIDLSNNPEISDYGALKNIKSIVLRENNISNAELLEPLTNVEYLDISKNDIGNITPLNNLTNLKILYIDENENITGILENNIEELSVKKCKLKDIDITKMKNLTSLDISNNEIDITKLLQNANDNLYIFANEITLSVPQLEYLINENKNLKNKNIYYGLYRPVINIDIETPYDLNNLKWLKLDNNIELENGTIQNNILYVIDNTNPIKLNLNNHIDYTIYDPIIIFNVK